jgi:sialidase-1
MRTGCIATIGLLLALAGTAWAEPRIEHFDVFTSGTDGYAAYRIPAIEAAADGSLVAFCEARKYNLSDPGFGEQDIDLACKRSTDGGRTWSAMQIIEDPGELWSAANPATVLDRESGRLWLLYLRSRPGRSTRTSRPGTDDMQTHARYSDDHGVTWSEPIDLTAVARDVDDPAWRASVVGPGGAIQDRHGRLLAPIWKVDPPGVFAIFSDDRGKTWQRGAMVPGEGVGNENQLVELADGRILMDVRQRGGPHRWMATSRDGGKTWSEARPGETVTPVACAIERLALSPSRIVWTGPKGNKRADLVLRVSSDEAKTFPEEHLVYEGLAAYSDLTRLGDNTVGILWERGVERGYQFITFTRFDLGAR